MTAQRDFDFHAGLAALTEYFLYRTNRLVVLAGLFQQSRYDDLMVTRAAQAFPWDQNVLMNAAVLGDHVGQTALAVQAADHRFMRTLQHFDDSPFRASAAIDSRDLNQHTVTVQHRAHFARRQDPLLENSERLPSTYSLDFQGQREINFYGQKLTLYVQDHIVHFYHLHALDWVDVVSALSADPKATSELAQSISDWPKSSPGYFRDLQARL